MGSTASATAWMGGATVGMVYGRTDVGATRTSSGSVTTAAWTSQQHGLSGGLTGEGAVGVDGLGWQQERVGC